MPMRDSPPDVFWEEITKDHHRVFMWVRPPGRRNRSRVVLGEVRRHRLEGRARRHWRAFPEGVAEFPDVFDNHVLALHYLKGRWESRQVVPESMRRAVAALTAAAKDRPVFGDDPWGDDEPE